MESKEVIYDTSATNSNSTSSYNPFLDIPPSSDLAPINGTQTQKDLFDNQTFSSSIYETTNTSNDSSTIDGSSNYFLSPDNVRLLYTILSHSSSAAVIIGCLLPYVPQYCTIYHNQSCSGFSTYVCLTQLIANILRIAFWFGHPFEIPLLIQSCIMIIGQLLLMELCVRVKSDCTCKHSFFSLDYRYFWRWTSIISFLEFLALFTMILSGLMYLLIINKQDAMIEGIGFTSVLIESMLGIPQLIKNYNKKSVLGMSLGMVFMWLLGDLYKTAYFILRDTPKQFWLCGSLQVTIDLLILCQVCIYRKKGSSSHVISVMPCC